VQIATKLYIIDLISVPRRCESCDFVILSSWISDIKTRNSSGDEIANVNFLYDDIVQCTRTRKYNRLLHKFRHRPFSVTQCNGHYAVHGHSRSPILMVTLDDIVLRRAVDQSNMSALRCRENVSGLRVAVRRAAGKLFQMTGPVSTKLLIASVVVVLGTDSNPKKTRYSPFPQCKTSVGNKSGSVEDEAANFARGTRFSNRADRMV